MRRLAIFAMIFFSDVALAAPRTAASDGPERASDPRNKIICKRFIETGSLVKGYRACKTKWEWERERENLRTLSVSDSCSTRGDPLEAIASGRGGCK